MLAFVSPAKKLDFTPMPTVQEYSQPQLLDQAENLVSKLKKLNREEIANLMKLSDKLADLNYERYRSFSTPFTLENAKQAIFAFRGDTYVGLDADTLSDDDLGFAQAHLRILSGLYGVLRPLDLMQAYRLEMGTKFANDKGKDLYAFWGAQIAEAINKDESDVVVNLASNEYFNAIDSKALKAQVITPVFKDVKDGKARVVGLLAKRARGMMARYIIKNQIQDSEKLKKFNDNGYKFNPGTSNDTHWEFIRQEA